MTDQERLVAAAKAIADLERERDAWQRIAERKEHPTQGPLVKATAALIRRVLRATLRTGRRGGDVEMTLALAGVDVEALRAG